MIGRVVGNYEIVEKLGEGGMGTVYRAVDHMVERSVAIKVLKPEIAQNADTLERFRSEAVALARLNHPSIATLFSFFKEGDELFMVMEFVPGETLEHLLRLHGSMKWQSAVEVLLWVLEGIQHAHHMGILHRDLKPANIMLTPDGRVKITDFGIARVLNTTRLTRESRLVGTLEYLAPERALGQPADARSDLYSLGVVFYEMLTGRLPFQADTDFAIIRAQLEQKPQAPHEIGVALPPVIEEVLMKSLAKDPAHRYPDAATFAAQFRNAVRTTGLSLSGPAKLTKLAEPQQQPHAPAANQQKRGSQIGVLAAVGAILVIAAGAAGWGVWRMLFPEKPKVTIAPAAESASAGPPQQTQIEPLGPAVTISPGPVDPAPAVAPAPTPTSAAPPPPSRQSLPRQQAAAPARTPIAEPNIADVIAALELTDGPVSAAAGGPRPIHYVGLLKAVHTGGSFGLPVVAQAVQQRGVNFQLSEFKSRELRAAGASDGLLQLVGTSLKGEVMVAQAPPPYAAPPVSQPAAQPRRVIRGLGDVRSIYVRPMPQNFDQVLRVEISSELGDRFRIVSSPGAADALLEIQVEDETGGRPVVGAAGRILGLSAKKKVFVKIVDPYQRRVLWSAEAGDRMTYLGSFGDGGRRMASRIAKKLRHDAPN